MRFTSRSLYRNSSSIARAWMVWCSWSTPAKPKRALKARRPDGLRYWPPTRPGWSCWSLQGSTAPTTGALPKTILSTFKTGRDIAGEYLLCADLQPQVSEKCWRSQTQYLAYGGGNLTSGDPGLWLVPNIARRVDAVTGRPVAGLVDQLSTGVLATASMRKTCAAIEESGPRDCGWLWARPDAANPLCCRCSSAPGRPKH